MFLGLAILASEFLFAQRVLLFVRIRYNAVMAWLGRQHVAVKWLSTAFTCVVVLVTLWVLGVFGWGAELIGLEQSWLQSPIGLGS